MAKKAKPPAVPVTLSLDIGPLSLTVEAVSWVGLSKAVAALMEARRLLRAEHPELAEAECRTIDVLPGGTPAHVPNVWDDELGRKRAGFTIP